MSLGVSVTLVGLTLVTVGLAASTEHEPGLLVGGGLAFAGGLSMTITGSWLIGDSKTTVEPKPMAL